MEDLWKLSRLDYRISTIAEHRDYEEIVRRYHSEESGNENELTPKNTVHRKLPNKE